VTSARRFPEIIIFFGPDGAGKTTQVKLLMKYLSSRKCRPWWTWIRGRHSLAFVLALLFTRLGYYQMVEAAPEKKNKVFDPRLLPKLRSMWGVIEFASVLPWIFLRVYLPKFLGYTVVAERYVIDTVAYLGYWLGQDVFESFLAKALLRFIPRGAVMIHLYAETEMLFKRIFDDDVTSDFIEFQQKVYPMLARSLGAVTINTSKLDVNETFKRILEVLNAE
jgi:thymidylate kinase